MADAHLPDAFYDLIAHHLPPEPPRVGPKGGRPRVAYRVAVRVIWFVLVTGCRWEDVPAELGCSGRTAHRRLEEWERLGVWDRLHADLLGLLKRAGKLDPDTVIVDGVIVRAFGGGEGSGPSPVDRSKPGTKYTLVVDRHGVPLAVRSTVILVTIPFECPCCQRHLRVLSMIGRDYRLTRDMERAAKTFGLDLAPQAVTLRLAYADAPGQAPFVWNMGYQARDAAEEIDALFRHLLPDVASDTPPRNWLPGYGSDCSRGL